MSNFKYLWAISTLFVAVLLISNVASTKIVAFFGMEFDAGTLLFPLSYIFGDIMTEVYGYGSSRKVIWMGLFMAAVMSGLFALVGALPAAEGWGLQDSYMAILGQTPRIVLASIIAYFCGEFSNSYTLAKLKIFTKGRFLSLRTISSTLVGEGIDTLLFVLIAFYGILPKELVIALIIWNYIFKVGVEVIFTPVTYLIVQKLKKSEGIDFFDKKTNFNPFKIN